MSATNQVAAVLRVPTNTVHPGRNARGAVGDVTELAVSIKAIGQRVPLQVYTAGPDRYEVHDGHRRLAAINQAGLPTVDIIVRTDPGDVLRIQQQLAIHAQGRPFDPMAEAEALEVLILEHKLRPEMVARALGKSTGWVSTRLALLNLNRTERDAVRDGRMLLREATAIVGQRRAERSGNTWTSPRPPAPAVTRHCSTCRCGAVA